MDCAQVERLAPLFVGGELEADVAEQVRRHVAACDLCQLTVDDHRESRDWLRDYRMPDLGSGAYDDLRKAVWQKIEDRPPRPAIVGFAGRSWEWLRLAVAQPAVAMAAVLFVGLGAFGMYRQHGAIQDASGRLEAAGEPTMAPADLRDLELEEELALDDGAEQILAQAGLEASEATGDPSERLEPFETAGDSKRVEIQTKNPDVRIIWFGPRDERAALEN